jgi:predicted nucleic acid-binding protein
MLKILVLDSGPLWLACLALGKPDADLCRRWIERMLAAGYLVIIPEIADYETRRELIRRGATANLVRLDGLKVKLDYRPITTAAMIRAAELWASVRTAGKPTAHPDALDGDCIVAAQALVEAGPGIVPIVATTNAAHFSRFPGIDARQWDTIS